MTLDEIKHLIEFIREQDLTEFELEQDGVKIRIKSGSAPDRQVRRRVLSTQLTARQPAARNRR